MKTLLLLLFALGAINAFRNGYEYEYRYEGFMKTGYPQIQHNFSVVALRGNVVFQIINERDARIKINNLEETTEITGVQGGMNGPFNFDYHRANSDLQTLEKPFYVNYLATEPEIIMKSYENDYAWHISMRKSIAAHFKPNFHEFYGQTEVQTDQENNLYGWCPSTYSMEQILHQDFPWAHNTHHVESNPPPFCNGETYNITRTINFDQCSDPVGLEKVGLGTFYPFNRNQDSSMLSRSSFTSYVVCGLNNNEGYDVTNVTSIGTILVNPYGMETEKIKTLSNQTFTLINRQNINKRIEIPENPRLTHTWSMEVTSPFQAGSDYKTWINFTSNAASDIPYSFESSFTGIQITDEQKHVFEERIEETLKTTARLLTSGRYPENPKSRNTDNIYASSARDLTQATRMVRVLSYEALNELYKKLVRESNDPTTQVTGSLYIDVLGAAASGPSTRVLTEHMMNDIHSCRTKSVYFTLTNSIASTENIPLLYNHITNLKMHEHPYVTTTAYLNYANLLRRVCVDRESSEFAVPKAFLGKAQCNGEHEVMQFVEFLTEKLENAKYTFEKTAIVSALSNLGSVIAMPVLKNAALGLYGRNTSIRVPAVYGFIKTKPHDFTSQQAQEFLYPIIENYLEDLQVRQTSVFVLLSYKPSGDVYRRLAQLTWRDPSRNMGSYIYSLLRSISNGNFEGYANQKNYATHALRFARSYFPSCVYSYNYMWASQTQKFNMDTLSMFNYIYSNESMVPGEMSTYLFNQYGGFDYSAYYFSMQSYNADNIYLKLFGISDFTNFEATKRMISRRFRSKGQDHISWRPQTMEPYQVVFLSRFYDNMEFLLPVDDDIISLLPENGKAWINSLMKGEDLAIVKYMDPANNEYWLPSEFGVPVAFRTNLPTVFSTVGKGKLETTANNNPGLMDLLTTDATEFSVEARFSTYNSFLSSVTAFLPWNKDSINSESERFQGFNVPARATYTIWNSLAPESLNSSRSFALEPTYEKDFEFFHAHNVPSLSIKGMWPGDNYNKTYTATIMTNRPLNEWNTEIPEEYFGFKTKFSFNSDTVNLFNRGTFGEIMNNPQLVQSLAYSPTSKFWDFTVKVDFAQAATNKINATYESWRPTVHTWASPANWTNALESERNDTRVYRRGSSFRLNMTGTTPRSYEFSYGSMTKFTTDHRYNTSSRYVATRSPLSDNYPNNGMACSQFYSVEPIAYDAHSFMDRIQEHQEYKNNIYGNWYFGTDCNNEKNLTTEGHLKISDNLRNQILRLYGDSDFYSTEEAGAPFYDNFHLQNTYTNANTDTSQNFELYFFDMLEQVASPRFYHKKSRYSNNKNYSINATRLIDSFVWQTHINFNNESSEYMTFKENDVPKAFYRPIQTTSFNTPDKQCVITKDTVRTSDFVHVNGQVYVANQCWTMTMTNKKYQNSFQLFTRQNNGELEGNLKIPDTGSIFTFTYKSITGPTEHKYEPGPDPEWIDYPYVQAFTYNDTTNLIVTENVTITISKNDIKILPYAGLKGSAGGICGDFNSEFNHEFIGPEFCIYNDFPLFVASWTSSDGDNCDTKELEKWSEKVQTFRKNCARSGEYYPGSNPIKPTDPGTDCLQYIYPIKRDRDLTCVSRDPVGYCLPRCKLARKSMSRTSYRCWPTRHMPEDVKYRSARGYTLVQPQTKSYTTSSFETNSAENCHY